VLASCALLFAGIIGNLTDRLRLGYVIDFILLYVRDFSWPVFNIADASICIGAALLAIDAIFDNGDTGRRSEGQKVEGL
jgi:signal peptidase II